MKTHREETTVAGVCQLLRRTGLLTAGEIDDLEQRWPREAKDRADLAELARGAIADESHRVRELLDQVAHQLFQVGLSLEATEELPGEVAQQRIAEALDRLDVTIHQIRDYAFDSPDDSLLPGA